MGAMTKHGGAVDIERPAPNMTPFQASAPHARAHPLNNKVAFEFGDGPDDDNDGPSERATSVDVFPEADELDAEPVQFVQCFQQVAYRPRQAVESPDQDHIKLPAAGVGHELVQAGALTLHPADAIGVLVDDL